MVLENRKKELIKKSEYPKNTNIENGYLFPNKK